MHSVAHVRRGIINMFVLFVIRGDARPVSENEARLLQAQTFHFLVQLFSFSAPLRTIYRNAGKKNVQKLRRCQAQF